MKCSELMIGDWIEINHNKRKVKVTAVYKNLIDTTSISPLMGDEVSPIPLTTEILERNFEKYNDNYIFSDDFFCFEIHEYNDGMWMLSYEINEMSLPNTQIANICYVHELQHVLRLCVLNELTDNFKVEE